jgi:probable blue pigment (indigoidine) exporter
MEGNRLTLLLTAVAPVAWGSTYFVTGQFLPADRPLFGATVRALPVGLVLLAFSRTLPKGVWWGRALVLGTLNIGAFFVLVYVAASRLPGGLAATLTATAPILMMLLAWLLIRERPRPVSLASAVVGLGGVALLVLRAGFVVDPLGVAASLAAVSMASLGFVLVKRWKSSVSLTTMAAWQLVGGGLLLLPVALLVEGAPPHLDRAAWAGFAYIGLVSTGLAYVVWFRGLRRLEAGAVAMIGLLNPVAGVVLGVLFAHESFGGVQLLGLALVLVGVLAAQPALQDRFRSRAPLAC